MRLFSRISVPARARGELVLLKILLKEQSLDEGLLNEWHPDKGLAVHLV